MPQRRFFPRRNSVMAGLLALSCAFFGGSIAPANLLAAPLELTAEQMLQVAGRAVSEHRPQAALTLTDALLEQGDPGGFQLWLIRSRAHRDLGQADTARMAAGRAWDLADTPKEKFTAALIMAQAQSSSGNRTLSQIWLRRAAQHAETEQQKALVRRDFRYVRDRNPWRVNLSFGAAPSSNINGGTSEDTFTGPFGMPFIPSGSLKGLSGTTAHAQLNLSYRLSRNQGLETWIGIEAYHRHAWLSSDAKALASNTKSSAFNYTMFAATLRHDRPIGNGRKLSFSGRLGRDWYGGEKLSDFASFKLEAALPVNDSNRLRLSGQITYQAESVDSIWLTDFDLNHLLLTEAGNGWNFSLGVSRSFSGSQSREYDELRAGVRWIKGQPVLGAQLSLGVDVRQRDFETFPFFDFDSRHDTSVSARAELRLPDLSQFGFSPTVSIEHRRTQSNIELFTSNRTNLSLGFSSDF